MNAARALLLVVTDLCAFLIHPAAARPRDDVMSNAFRCAAIGDTRLWLDCYYGAAQPARLALGLRPVPSVQLALVANPPPSAGPSGAAELHDQVLSQAFSCKTISEDRYWLDCYYAAAQPVRAQLGLSPSAQSRTSQDIVAASSAHTVPFGMPAIRQSEIPAAVDHLSTRMATYNFDSRGIFTVTLANGQTWRQVSGDTTLAHFTKPPADYGVRISRGLLGSYNLTVPGIPGIFKVRRLE
jgi:hypothetical protein